MNHFIVSTLAVVCSALILHTSAGDEKLAGKACRSVHLSYPAPPGTAFTTEMTVEASAPGTYFMACGWNKGYFGIQELGNGKKLALFSVWDSNQNNPNAVDKDQRTQLVFKGEQTRIGRFGGEGTGGQSFLDIDWKLNEPYRFLVTSQAEGKRTIYTGYLRGPNDKEWTKMVAFSTITGGKPLAGYYSFVEDFRRNGESLKHVRKAKYGNAWLRSVDRKWTELTEARFTADSNPALNIDAGLRGAGYFLATGGDTKNVGVKLRETIKLREKSKLAAPSDLLAIP